MSNISAFVGSMSMPQHFLCRKVSAFEAWLAQTFPCQRFLRLHVGYQRSLFKELCVPTAIKSFCVCRLLGSSLPLKRRPDHGFTNTRLRLRLRLRLRRRQRSRPRLRLRRPRMKLRRSQRPRPRPTETTTKTQTKTQNRSKTKTKNQIKINIRLRHMSRVIPKDHFLVLISVGPVSD